MKKDKKTRGWCLVLALMASAPAAAQLEVSSSTFDGGGGTSSGGSFEVSGTAGQFDAGLHSGGSFDLEGGFWNSAHPSVPVELMGFEIVSCPLEDGGWPRGQQNTGPPLEVTSGDSAAPETVATLPAGIQALRPVAGFLLLDGSDVEAR